MDAFILASRDRASGATILPRGFKLYHYRKVGRLPTGTKLRGAPPPMLTKQDARLWALTCKGTGDPGRGEAPPAGVGVDRRAAPSLCDRQRVDGKQLAIPGRCLTLHAEDPFLALGQPREGVEEGAIRVLKPELD
jgi:hypothetical protein